MAISINTIALERHLLATMRVVAGMLTVFFFGMGTSDASIEAPASTVSGASGTPAGLAKLLIQAQEAMKQNHPEVAVIYLKNAASLAPNNALVHMDLGDALLNAGDPETAERELRSALRYSAPAAQVLPHLYQAMLSLHEEQELLAQFPDPQPNDHSSLASETLRARAYALSQTDQKQSAVASMDRALAITRTTQNLTARAQLASDMGDMNLAMKLTNEALAKAPSYGPAMMVKVKLLQLANQSKQALAIANDLVRQNTRNPTALITRAGVYLQLGQNAEGLADVNATLALVPNMPLAVYYKSLAMAQAKDPRGAWTLAQTLPPSFLRSRADVAILVSQMAVDAGYREIGANILSSTVIDFPNDFVARIRLGMDYLQLKDAQSALNALVPLKDSADPRALVLLGQAYAMLHQYGESVKYLEKANATGFGGDVLKQQVASSNLRMGNIDAATKEFQELNAKQPGNPEIAGPLIAALLRKNELDAGLAVANKLASAATKSAYGPFFQGQLLMQKGELNGAVAAFSQSIAREPKFIPALYDRAIAEAVRGDLQSANTDLQAVLATDPKNAMAMIKEAQFAAQAGQDERVLPLLKRAVAADPKDITPNLALANYYLERKQLKDATAVMDAFLRASPKDSGALTMQATIQLAAGATDQAIGALRQLEKAQPESAEIQRLLAIALAQKNDTQEAIGAYQRAIQLAPTVQQARTDLIRYALSTKNDALALSAARDYASQEPGESSSITLAETLAALKKFDEAQELLTRALAHQPSGAIIVSLSTLLRQRGDKMKADALLADWTAKHPDDISVRLVYAQSLSTTKPASAEQLFRATLKQQPYNLEALNNLAWLLREKNPKEALPYAERALIIAPQSSAVLDTLVWIKWQLNDRAQSLVLLQRAHTSDPKNAEINYHLAVALDDMGDHMEAKKILTALLASNQAFEDGAKAQALDASWK